MWRTTSIGLVALCVSAAGCWSKTGAGQLNPSSGSALGKSSQPAPFGDARYQNLVREVEQNGGTASFDSQPKSTTQKITGAVSAATASVVNALTPKPKVIKAADPVALGSMPEKIHPNLYYQAGRLAESSGNEAAAIKQYQGALTQDPAHLPSLVSLARLHDRQERFGEAEKLYRQAIEVEPDNAMAYNDFGLCLARQNRDEEAAMILRRAAKLEPTRKLYHNNLATVLVAMGRTDEAWNVLKHAHPTGVAHYNLGYLLHRHGESQAALHHFTLAWQNDQSLAVARDMVEQLNGPLLPPPSQLAQTSQAAEDSGLTAAPKTDRYRVTATPVSSVVSPPAPRRIPATGSVHDHPVRSGDRGPAQQPVPRDEPRTRLPPPSIEEDGDGNHGTLQYPIRQTSGTATEADLRDLDLPTPERISD